MTPGIDGFRDLHNCVGGRERMLRGRPELGRATEVSPRETGGWAMSRLAAANLERVRLLGILLAVLGGLLLAADRAAADEPGEDNPPAILGGAVSPSSLSFEGGNVQLSAEVVDDFGVSMIYAVVYGPDGTNQIIQLFQGNENTYFGTLEVPPNHSDSAVGYGVEVQVYDTNGAFVASSIGEVQVEAAPQFDEAPIVSDALLTPQFLPAAGGAVTISAEASDNRSVSTVFATIALPGGGSTEVPLQPVSSSHYEGTFAAPPNPGPAAAEYLVEISAQDDIGQETRVIAGAIAVEAPPVQVTGRLAVRPGSTSFGSVKIGKRAWRLLVVRNSGPRRSPPVEGVVSVSGSSAFSLVGAPAEGVHVRLRPGEVRFFLVEFRPERVGPQAGSLTIARDDGGQPGLAAALTGQGAPANRWRPHRH